MEQVIARRGNQFLVQTGPDKGRILDPRGYYPEMFLQSLLARGYWEDASMSLDDARREVQERKAR